MQVLAQLIQDFTYIFFICMLSISHGKSKVVKRVRKGGNTLWLEIRKRREPDWLQLGPNA